MPGDSTLAARLDAFLESRHATRDRLIAAADGSFGPPLLVVATGSVLQGFGNASSDVDLSVVVDAPVGRLSLTSHDADALVDTTYFGQAEVEDWTAALRRPWPSVRESRHERDRREVQLRYGTRFRDSITLSARDGWDAWAAQFREPWLADRVVDWWRIEATRRRLAARWLAETRPLLAAQRMLEAVLAALESRAAAAGHLYFAPKWLSEKLRREDDTDAIAIMRAAMRMPIVTADVPSYMARAEAWLDELGIVFDARLAAQLWYLSGVAVRPLDARTLVSRWNLRAIEVRGAVPPVAASETPIWVGDLDASPPDDLLSLFVNDMTWLSIVSRAA